MYLTSPKGKEDEKIPKDAASDLYIGYPLLNFANLQHSSSPQ